jgi:hypothetical protein
VLVGVLVTVLGDVVGTDAGVVAVPVLDAAGELALDDGWESTNCAERERT